MITKLPEIPKCLKQKTSLGIDTESKAFAKSTQYVDLQRLSLIAYYANKLPAFSFNFFSSR